MSRFLLRWVINAIALYAAIFICSGIDFANGWDHLAGFDFWFDQCHPAPDSQDIFPAIDRPNPGTFQPGDQHFPVLVDQCSGISIQPDAYHSATCALELIPGCTGGKPGQRFLQPGVER